MNFNIITIFPEMLQALHYGIVGRALKNGLCQLHCFNPRDYTNDKQHRVDDTPYGGGPGMVMLAQPLHDTINAARKNAPKAPVIHLTPQGIPFTQQQARELAQKQELIFLAGRYEGIDERIIKTDVDLELSIGDYVLSGGELAAMVIIDAIVRMIPGSLGDQESAQQDSFMNGLLDYPHYTKPQLFNGQTVPNVLLSGHHEKVARWRLQQALGRTYLRRPDLLKKRVLTIKEKELLKEFINEVEK